MGDGLITTALANVPHDVGNGGRRQLRLERRNGSTQRRLQAGLDMPSDHALLIRTRAMQGEQGLVFNGAINVKQSDRFCRSRQKRAPALSQLRVRQTGAIEHRQQATNYRGVGVRALGDDLRSQRLSLMDGQTAKDVDGNGKATAGRHSEFLFGIGGFGYSKSPARWYPCQG